MSQRRKLAAILSADVVGSVAKYGKISMKRVSQGVVMTLIGAAILIGALYFTFFLRRRLSVNCRGRI